MPDQNDPKASIITPTQQHQQVAEGVAAQLRDILGSDTTTQQVLPTTAETPLPVLNETLHKIGLNDEQMDQFSDVANRVTLDRPGSEPSKSFLKRLLERVKKKNPEIDVKLVKK